MQPLVKISCLLCACTQIFTSLPAFAIGIMDQDVSSTARKSLPKLYRTSQTGREFNAKVCIEGAAVCTYVFTFLIRV